MSTYDQIYHERQIRELCALHALNNLFQIKNFFSKADLDKICYSLSPDMWINPHKSIFGLGNYDINVIMKALQEKGYEAIWFDKRKDPGCLNLNRIVGFILNVPSEYKLGFVMLPLRRRHWITIRQIDGTYFNLDSKLDEPEVIGDENNLLAYLREQLEHVDKQVFLVVPEEDATTQSWLLNRDAYNTKLTDREAEVLSLTDIISNGVNVTINPLCTNKLDQLSPNC